MKQKQKHFSRGQIVSYCNDYKCEEKDYKAGRIIEVKIIDNKYCYDVKDIHSEEIVLLPEFQITHS